MEAHYEHPVPLVKGGSLLYDNLMKIGKNEPWLRDALSQLQIYDIREVRYALLDTTGQIHVLKS